VSLNIGPNCMRYPAGSHEAGVVSASFPSFTNSCLAVTIRNAIAGRVGPCLRFGVYRLWRDSGYALAAILAGMVADQFGIQGAIVAVGVLTLSSGSVPKTPRSATSPGFRATFCGTQGFPSTQTNWMEPAYTYRKCLHTVAPKRQGPSPST
jgi:hypothetical protein